MVETMPFELVNLVVIIISMTIQKVVINLDTVVWLKSLE